MLILGFLLNFPPATRYQPRSTGQAKQRTATDRAAPQADAVRIKIHSKMSNINCRRQALVPENPGELGRNGQKVDEEKVDWPKKRNRCPDFSTPNALLSTLSALRRSTLHSLRITFQPLRLLLLNTTSDITIQELLWLVNRTNEILSERLEAAHEIDLRPE
jgi:hypothetical protein